jgi:hypothetical protein
MNNQSTKTPIAFWIIGVIGLLWNGFGVVNWVRQTFMLDAVLEDVPEEQHVLYENIPLWLTLIFGIAVITGTLACIGLLMKKKWAVPLFLVSLITIVVQMGYGMLSAESREILGPTFFILPVIVILVGALLYYYSRSAASKGLLS